jgi:hypothetical protein
MGQLPIVAVKQGYRKRLPDYLLRHGARKTGFTGSAPGSTGILLGKLRAAKRNDATLDSFRGDDPQLIFLSHFLL